MIKKYLFNLSQQYISKPFVKYQPTKNFVDIKKLPLGYYKSFGKLNKDKTFYVIWLDGRGSGFFSNVSSALCHLKIAGENNLIPVVDFQNFPTLYNENNAVNHTQNSWNYYFKPVSNYSLEEVYHSRNVIFSTGKYPEGMSYAVTQNIGLYSIYRKYIKVDRSIQNIVKKYVNKFNINSSRILGIHFRGQEQKYAAGHSFPPTLKQMFKQTDEILAKFKIEKIFLVTEDSYYLKKYVDRYGSKVMFTNMFRVHGVNAYNLRPRENHMYMMGREVLVDTLLLSKCTGILCGDSNVSELARFINNHQYEFSYRIDNGVNSSSPYLARVLYDIKRFLPSKLGGLKNKIIISS